MSRRRGRGGSGWSRFFRSIRDFFRRLFDAIRHVTSKNKKAAGGWAPGTRNCVLCVQPTHPADRCPNHPACVCEECCLLHGLCDKDD